MLDINDFSKKQIVIYTPHQGDKLSYKNDNMIIKDKDGKVKYQQTCYRLFMLLVIGDVSITTGLLRRAQKFGFSIAFMTYSFRVYSEYNFGMQGNTLLHRKQYEYNSTEIARYIIKNKLLNQRRTLSQIRRKTEFIKEGIELLDRYVESLCIKDLDRATIVGIEGNASKVYFARVFNNTKWIGRKPRIKFDYINSLMDIGYTILFNFIDCILNVYGFDVYQGVLHTNFYMRKSLVCDIMEPFRPIIDWKIRKGINLGQFKEEDFIIVKNQYQLEYKSTSKYSGIFMEELLKNKESIFLYIRGYYRAFMKGLDVSLFPEYNLIEDSIIFTYDEE